MKALRDKDFLIGLFLSCLAVWYWWIAGAIRMGATHPSDIGPRTLPIIYAAILLVLSVSLMVKSLVTKAAEEAEPQERKTLFLAVLSMALATVYYFALSKVGFVISSTLLLLGATRILSEEKQNYWKLLLIYLVIVVGISFVFGKWFLVDFPEPLIDYLGV